MLPNHNINNNSQSQSPQPYANQRSRNAEGKNSQGGRGIQMIKGANAAQQQNHQPNQLQHYLAVQSSGPSQHNLRRNSLSAGRRASGRQTLAYFKERYGFPIYEEREVLPLNEQKDIERVTGRIIGSDFNNRGVGLIDGNRNSAAVAMGTLNNILNDAGAIGNSAISGNNRSSIQSRKGLSKCSPNAAVANNVLDNEQSMDLSQTRMYLKSPNNAMAAAATNISRNLNQNLQTSGVRVAAAAGGGVGTNNNLAATQLQLSAGMQQMLGTSGLGGGPQSAVNLPPHQQKDKNPESLTAGDFLGSSKSEQINWINRVQVTLIEEIKIPLDNVAATQISPTAQSKKGITKSGMACARPANQQNNPDDESQPRLGQNAQPRKKQQQLTQAENSQQFYLKKRKFATPFNSVGLLLTQQTMHLPYLAMSIITTSTQIQKKNIAEMEDLPNNALSAAEIMSAQNIKQSCIRQQRDNFNSNSLVIATLAAGSPSAASVYQYNCHPQMQSPVQEGAGVTTHVSMHHQTLAHQHLHSIEPAAIINEARREDEEEEKDDGGANANIKNYPTPQNLKIHQPKEKGFRSEEEPQIYARFESSQMHDGLKEKTMAFKRIPNQQSKHSQNLVAASNQINHQCSFGIQNHIAFNAYAKNAPDANQEEIDHLSRQGMIKTAEACKNMGNNAVDDGQYEEDFQIPQQDNKCRGVRQESENNRLIDGFTGQQASEVNNYEQEYMPRVIQQVSKLHWLNIDLCEVRFKGPKKIMGTQRVESIEGQGKRTVSSNNYEERQQQSVGYTGGSNIQDAIQKSGVMNYQKGQLVAQSKQKLNTVLDVNSRDRADMHADLKNPLSHERGGELQEHFAPTSGDGPYAPEQKVSATKLNEYFQSDFMMKPVQGLKGKGSGINNQLQHALLLNQIKLTQDEGGGLPNYHPSASAGYGNGDHPGQSKGYYLQYIIEILPSEKWQKKLDNENDVAQNEITPMFTVQLIFSSESDYLSAKAFLINHCAILYPKMASDFTFVKVIGSGSQATVNLYRSKDPLPTQKGVGGKNTSGGQMRDISRQQQHNSKAQQDQYEQFAVKRCLVETKPNSVNRAFLLNEIKYMRELRLCENIAQLHSVYIETDANTGNKYYLLVIKFAKFGTVFSYYQQKKSFTEDLVREIMTQLLLSLDFMHQRGIIHRDIKGENILILDQPISTQNAESGQKCELKLCISDLGFACQEDDEKLCKLKCGTPGYLPPEVFRGQKFTQKADIFSTGSLFYSLITGRNLFSGTDAKTVLKLNLNYDPAQEVLTHVGKHVSPECKNLILQMVKVNPLERFTAKQCLNHPWFMKDHEAIQSSLFINENAHVLARYLQDALNQPAETCQESQIDHMSSFIQAPNYYQGLGNNSFYSQHPIMQGPSTRNICGQIEGFGSSIRAAQPSQTGMTQGQGSTDARFAYLLDARSASPFTKELVLQVYGGGGAGVPLGSPPQEIKQGLRTLGNQNYQIQSIDGVGCSSIQQSRGNVRDSNPRGTIVQQESEERNRRKSILNTLANNNNENSNKNTGDGKQKQLSNYGARVSSNAEFQKMRESSAQKSNILQSMRNNRDPQTSQNLILNTLGIANHRARQSFTQARSPQIIGPAAAANVDGQSSGGGFHICYKSLLSKGRELLHSESRGKFGVVGMGGDAPGGGRIACASNGGMAVAVKKKRSTFHFENKGGMASSDAASRHTPKGTVGGKRNKEGGGLNDEVMFESIEEEDRRKNRSNMKSRQQLQKNMRESSFRIQQRAKQQQQLQQQQMKAEEVSKSQALQNRGGRRGTLAGGLQPLQNVNIASQEPQQQLAFQWGQEQAEESVQEEEQDNSKLGNGQCMLQNQTFNPKPSAAQQKHPNQQSQGISHQPVRQSQQLGYQQAKNLQELKNSFQTEDENIPTIMDEFSEKQPMIGLIEKRLQEKVPLGTFIEEHNFKRMYRQNPQIKGSRKVGGMSDQRGWRFAEPSRRQRSNQRNGGGSGDDNASRDQLPKAEDFIQEADDC